MYLIYEYNRLTYLLTELLLEVLADLKRDLLETLKESKIVLKITKLWLDEESIKLKPGPFGARYKDD